MDWLATNQRSHFIATLMKNLIREARIDRHFTTQYCPWGNGTVERLCREVLRTVRGLLSECKLPATQWPSMVDAIQKIINQSALNRLERSKQRVLRCSMEVFNGLKRSIMIIHPVPLRPYREMKTLNNADITAVTETVILHDFLDRMRKAVAANNMLCHIRAQRVHNSKTNVTPLNAIVVDYVKIRTHTKREHTLQSKWRGQMLVKEAKFKLVLVVEDLSDEHQYMVHAQRTILYSFTKRKGGA